MPTPKLPKEPVETLMKLNAIAKFDRKPSVRRNSGLMPSERRWASSCAAMSCECSDTILSSYHRTIGARLTSGERTRGTPGTDRRRAPSGPVAIFGGG